LLAGVAEDRVELFVGMPLRYGRSLDMASIGSATATIGQVAAFLRLSGRRVACFVPRFVVVADDGHHHVELLRECGSPGRGVF
jgi:hypothetical protein